MKRTLLIFLSAFLWSPLSSAQAQSISGAKVSIGGSGSLALSVAPALGPQSLGPLQSGPLLLAPSALPSLLAAHPAAPAPGRTFQVPAVHATPLSLPAKTVQQRFESQIAAMGAELKRPDDPTLAVILSKGRELLSRIAGLIGRGEIDPSVRLRASPDDPPVPTVERTITIGVYPVTADPFHWGHLIAAMTAMAELKLDKVVFVIAGDDPRKTKMTQAPFRHAMGRHVLGMFAPLFGYSSIAMGTNFDGETNIFRILKLNEEQSIHAYYIVGGDHYRLTDAKGNDDTLLKIEKGLHDPNRYNPAKQSVSLAFIERDEPLEEIATPLDVHLLPGAGFDASSTKARAGHYELMPFSAYEYARSNWPGLYGIQP